MIEPKHDDSATSAETLDATITKLWNDHEAVIAETQELGERYNRRTTEYVYARTEQARLAVETATQVYEQSKKSEEAWIEYVAKGQQEAVIRANFERSRRAASDAYVREITAVAETIVREIVDEQIKEMQK